MISLGILSYGTGTLLFLIMSLVLLTGQQGRSRKNALKFAAVVSTGWLGFTAVAIYYDVSFFSYLVEPVRSFSWLLFLGYILVSSVTDTRMAGRRLRKAILFAASYTTLLVMIVLYRLFAGPLATIFLGLKIPITFRVTVWKNDLVTRLSHKDRKPVFLK